MEVSFSVKPQALSAITCAPISSCFSSGQVRSFSREFLGSGLTLRQPGLRTRRKCKKSGFQFCVRSPNFQFKASLESQSALAVVAVVTVTVSALTVVYFNNSKRKLNVKEISQQLSVVLSKQLRIILNWDVLGQFLRPSNVPTDKFTSHKKTSVNEIRDYSHHHEDFKVEEEITHLPLVSITPESPHLSVVASTIVDSLSHNNSISTNSSSQTATIAELAIEEKELHLEGAKLPVLMVKTGLNGAASDAICVNKLGGAHNGHVLEVSKSSLTFTPRETIRKGLHTFYDASSTNSYNVEAVKKNYRVASMMNGSATVVTETLSSENRVKEGPNGYHNEEFSSTSNDSQKIKEFSVNNSSKSLFVDTVPKEDDITNGRNPRKFSAYNQFLREGRLIECIQMLEDLESKGLLDMDNVYHTGFFRACKIQKAVNEAFRFTRLIPNPTLSTFNMLLTVCASSQDSEGAFQVLQFVNQAGLKADCKLYTTLVSTCAKSGKVDTMFEVFHEMVNAGIEPNVHTYSALIDGCAKAGQVAKAFGAYGILRSKNVKPDRVIFNALITACGQSGAVDRAFDVLGEMRAELQPIDPDHVTVGALMKACVSSGQIERSREVYNIIDKYNIKGTPEVYTIAINSCSQGGDWDFACRVYDDMTRKGVAPDEILVSALIDVAGHADKIDAAFDVLEEAKIKGVPVGVIAYSSLMGACSNAKNWQKAVQLYEDIKGMNLKPTVPMMNALITALCDGDQLQKAVDALHEIRKAGLSPNTITYSILLVASEKKDDLENGLMLLSQAKKDGLVPNLVMCRCLLAMCLRRFQKACKLGEPVMSSNSGRLQLDSKWTSLVLRVYRETITAGVAPTAEELSQVLGCLRLPYDASIKTRLIENLGVCTDTSKGLNLCSLLDGFGEYDPRAFSLLEEATSRGIIPFISFSETPLIIDVRDMQVFTAEVYILAVVRGLKNRLAADGPGAKLPNMNILLPIEETEIQTPTGEKTLNLAGRMTQAIAALFRRLGLAYQGNASQGKIRILGVVLKKWLRPKIHSSFSNGNLTDFSLSQTRIGKQIFHQQRSIRSGNLSLE